jgi:hypothetical protein
MRELCGGVNPGDYCRVAAARRNLQKIVDPNPEKIFRIRNKTSTIADQAVFFGSKP